MEFMALGFPNYCPPRVGDRMYETTACDEDQWCGALRTAVSLGATAVRSPLDGINIFGAAPKLHCSWGTFYIINIILRCNNYIYQNPSPFLEFDFTLLWYFPLSGGCCERNRDASLDFGVAYFRTNHEQINI